jgi:peptidoglycan/LPS O-acetylase OafA/YrhL
VHRIVLHSVGVSQGYIYEAFDCRADHLAIGCLLAIALRNGWLPELWRWLCSHAGLAWINAGLLAASTAAYLHFGTPYRDTIGFIVEPVLVATFLVQVIALSITTSSWAWLNARWIRFLGRISYSTYLYQQLVPNYIEKLHVAPLLETLLVVAAVIALASASYFLVEKPFLRIKDRLAVRHEQQ